MKGKQPPKEQKHEPEEPPPPMTAAEHQAEAERLLAVSQGAMFAPAGAHAASMAMTHAVLALLKREAP